MTTIPSSARLTLVLVAVFAGTFMALLDHHYTLVGECYAHGLMNGEALSDESLAEEDFVII